jgi:hypothetical protein
MALNTLKREQRTFVLSFGSPSSRLYDALCAVLPAKIL